MAIAAAMQAFVAAESLRRSTPKASTSDPSTFVGKESGDSFSTSDESISPTATSSLAAPAERIQAMLRGDAAHRQNFAWWGIAPEAIRDEMIARINTTERVRIAWQDLLQRKEAKLFGRETDYEECIADLINAFGREAGSIAGKSPQRAVAHGKWGVENPTSEHRPSDDQERNKPDIAIGLPTIDRESNMSWDQLSCVTEVKPKDASDLSDSMLLQVLRYARKLLQYHESTKCAHVLTWCGQLVRVWYFDAAAFSVSKALRIDRIEDRFEIGKILWLITVEPETLCRRLGPVQDTVFKMALHSGEVETWQWVDEPKVLSSSSALFGSRTVVCHGSAGAVGQPSRPIFAKYTWVDELLVGHEGQMQKLLADLPHTPRPIGKLPVESPQEYASRCTVNPSHPGHAPRFLDAIFYEHRRGISLAFARLGEGDLAAIFAQLTNELLEYAERGLHYRDFNTGNVLAECDDQEEVVRQGNRVVLVLVDHGNMRHGYARRRGPGPRLLYQSSAQDEEIQGPQRSDFFLEEEAVPADDARSANPLFLPHSVIHAQSLLASYKLANSQLAHRKSLPSPKAALVAKLESDSRFALQELLMSAHRSVDDLESAVWLLFWLTAQGAADARADTEMSLHTTMIQDKEFTWTKGWRLAISNHCGATSYEWQYLLEQVQHSVHAAQRSVRSQLAERLEQVLPEMNDREGRLDSIEMPLLPVERDCFRDVGALFTAFADSSL
ncbi:unnamed protein product [Jaminaea pallidilutea]